MEEFTQLTTDKGLYKKILKEGDGSESPQDGDAVIVKYKGILEDGIIIDQAERLSFVMGNGWILGWEKAIKTMKRGEISVIVMRDDYAYGDAGYEHIPPKACLIFLIEILDFYVSKEVNKQGQNS